MLNGILLGHLLQFHQSRPSLPLTLPVACQCLLQVPRCMELESASHALGSTSQLDAAMAIHVHIATFAQRMRSETARRQKKLHYVRALWNQSEMQIVGTHELCGLPLFWPRE